MLFILICFYTLCRSRFMGLYFVPKSSIENKSSGSIIQFIALSCASKLTRLKYQNAIIVKINITDVTLAVK